MNPARRRTAPRSWHAGERRSRPDVVGLASVVNSVDSISTGDRYRIAVPVPTGDRDPDDEAVWGLLDLAVAMATEHDGEIVILYVVTVPDQTPLGCAAEQSVLDSAHERVQELCRELDKHAATSGVVCVAHRKAEAVLKMVKKYECDVMLLEDDEQSSQLTRVVRRRSNEKLIARAPCDVLVKAGETSPDRSRRVLLAASTDHTRRSPPKVLVLSPGRVGHR